MRERLTASFIILSIVLLLGAGAVRTYVLRDLFREQLAGQLDSRAQLVGHLLADRARDGDPIDAALLETLVESDERLEYVAAPDASPLVVAGADWAAAHGDPADAEDPAADDADDEGVSASADAGDSATVTLTASPSVVGEIVGRDVGSIAALFLLIAVGAGMAGFLVATALSAPFQRLAVAAGALGRGRFDLDLPDTKIPEAREIASALRSSALALEDRVQRERAFAEHASHVLRTPLTGVRLELEDLSLRDDLPLDAQESVTRCLARVDQVSAVATELVEIARRGSLMVGAEVPLSDLSTQLAQRWADRLAARNRALTAAVEGDLSLTYTPGPLEHVTDLLLADVVRRGTGAVRIVFHAESAGQLRISVLSAERSAEEHSTEDGLDRMAQVRVVVESLGGRVSGEHPADGVEVLLPRR